MIDAIIILIVLMILGTAIWYIRRQKKKGAKCIGCPYAGACAKQKQNGCE